LEIDPLSFIILANLLFYSPFWLPIAFAILIAMRRNANLRQLFCFLALECVAVGLSLLVVRVLTAMD
jgi:hypothetical protein